MVLLKLAGWFEQMQYHNNNIKMVRSISSIAIVCLGPIRTLVTKPPSDESIEAF